MLLFVIDSNFELCLRCFISVDLVDLGMLQDVLSAKSFVWSATRSPQQTGSLQPQTMELGLYDDRDSLSAGPSSLGSGSSGRGCSH